MRAGRGRLTLPDLRGFLMAQLQWTPRTVWHDATLRDIAEACHAWHCPPMDRHMPQGLPDADFLREMMQRFPDHPKTGE